MKNLKIKNSQRGVSLIITFFTAFYIFFVRRVQAMNNAGKVIRLKSEKGVSLIITFFIMVIILLVVLSVSVLLYSEVKVIRNMSDSVASIFAADSGIEKVLYYDRRIMPLLIDGKTSASRGLCSMIKGQPTGFNDYNPNSNSAACDVKSGNTPTDTDSIYCNDAPNDPNPLVPQGLDCDPATCTNCTVKFSTTFDNRNYSVSAKVYPVPCPGGDGDCASGQTCGGGGFCTGDSAFEIDSRGAYGSAQREIQIITTPN